MDDGMYFITIIITCKRQAVIFCYRRTEGEMSNSEIISYNFKISDVGNEHVN